LSAIGGVGVGYNPLDLMPQEFDFASAFKPEETSTYMWTKEFSSTSTCSSDADLSGFMDVNSSHIPPEWSSDKLAPPTTFHNVLLPL
jgi:hypothetical protein